MPNNRRQQILQHYDGALNAIDRALAQLGAIREMYGAEAPTHARGVELIALALVQVRQLLEEFRARYM